MKKWITSAVILEDGRLSALVFWPLDLPTEDASEVVWTVEEAVAQIKAGHSLFAEIEGEDLPVPLRVVSGTDGGERIDLVQNGREPGRPTIHHLPALGLSSESEDWVGFDQMTERQIQEFVIRVQEMVPHADDSEVRVALAQAYPKDVATVAAEIVRHRSSAARVTH